MTDNQVSNLIKVKIDPFDKIKKMCLNILICARDRRKEACEKHIYMLIKVNQEKA